MARKKSGGFGKVLEFIGLVDDDEPRDNYEDEFESGSYGKPQAYAPQRASRAQERPRQEVSRRYSSSYEPTRAPRMNRNSQQSSRFDSGRAPQQAAQRRPAPRDERPQRYDYSPRSSRFGSLDDDSPRFEAQPPRNPREGASRQRTVMYSLRTLKDCCEVIDNLIENNTVVLTLDEMEPALMQRAVDTLSGAVFALRATIRKASDCTYLIAPMTVEVNETYDADDRFF